MIVPNRGLSTARGHLAICDLVRALARLLEKSAGQGTDQDGAHYRDISNEHVGVCVDALHLLVMPDKVPESPKHHRRGVREHHGSLLRAMRPGDYPPHDRGPERPSEHN